MYNKKRKTTSELKRHISWVLLKKYYQQNFGITLEKQPSKTVQEILFSHKLISKIMKKIITVLVLAFLFVSCEKEQLPETKAIDVEVASGVAILSYTNEGVVYNITLTEGTKPVINPFHNPTDINVTCQGACVYILDGETYTQTVNADF